MAGNDAAAEWKRIAGTPLYLQLEVRLRNLHRGEVKVAQNQGRLDPLAVGEDILRRVLQVVFDLPGLANLNEESHLVTSGHAGGEAHVDHTTPELGLTPTELGLTPTGLPERKLSLSSTAAWLSLTTWLSLRINYVL